MSRKGGCCDNAVAESFFGSIKTELINHYKFKTREEARHVIFEYREEIECASSKLGTFHLST